MKLANVRAVAIDLDGTLCNVSHRVHYVKQNPPDWTSFFDACVNDTPNPAVAALVRMAHDARYTILFVSGRPETHRRQTETWLERHELALHDRLLMRPEGDYRADDVVKRELYEQYIAGRYDILFVVDDRASVVAMWRSLGLTCLQVAEGNF